MMFLKDFTKFYAILTLAIITCANSAFGMESHPDSKTASLRVNVSESYLPGSTTVSPEASLRSPIKLVFASTSNSLRGTPAASLRSTPDASLHATPVASTRVSPAPSSTTALISNVSAQSDNSRSLTPSRLTFQQSGTVTSVNSNNNACISDTPQQLTVQDSNGSVPQKQMLSSDNEHDKTMQQLNTVNDDEDENSENNDENSNEETCLNVSQAEKIIDEIVDNDDAEKWSTKQTDLVNTNIVTRPGKEKNTIVWTIIRNITFLAHCKNLENPLEQYVFSTPLTAKLISEKFLKIKTIINDAYPNKTPCRIYRRLCFNKNIKKEFELVIEKDSLDLADDDITVLAETLFNLKQSNATPESEVAQHCLSDATIEDAFKKHKTTAPSFRFKQTKKGHGSDTFGTSAPHLELHAINENKTSNDQTLENITVVPLAQVLDNDTKECKAARKYEAEPSVSRLARPSVSHFEAGLLYKTYDDDIRKIADRISLIADEKDASAILEKQINSLTQSKDAKKAEIKHKLFIKTMIRMTAFLAFCKNQPEFDKDAVFSKPEVVEQLLSLIGCIIHIIKTDVWTDIKKGKIAHLKMKYKDSANKSDEALLREHWDEIWKNLYLQLPTSPYLNETHDGTTTLEDTIENKVFQKKVVHWCQCCSQELIEVPLEFTPEDQLQLMKNIARLQAAQALPPSDDNYSCSCVVQ